MEKQVQQKDIICIDGSSWTGKSTVARALAGLFGYHYMNTGAMFRAVAYLIQEKNLATEGEIKELLKGIIMEFRQVEGASRLFVNGEDFTPYISSNNIIHFTSKIAALPDVRQALLGWQRKMAENGGFVVEGRDVGTAVFPEAKWKFYLDASLDVKIKRFFKMLSPAEKENYTVEQVRELIQKIDEEDSSRKVAPLQKPADAIYYENSDSPSAEHDAVVLWHYIFKSREIIGNAKILAQKLQAEPLTKPRAKPRPEK